MKRSVRQSLVAASVVALAITGTVVGVNSAGTEPPSRVPAAEGLPGSMAAHVQQLTRSAPGRQEVLEGPGSAAEAAFQQRAYPRDTISIEKIEEAKQSFQRVLARTAALERQASLRTTGRKAARPSTRAKRWEVYGPSNALYPFTERRNSTNYVPNRYVAGGRTTDLAIAETCVPGNCRMYITPAGGGVWRTNDAMARPVQWRYLGGPFGINAAGAVTIDPTDPSGRTIWVGTGEANVCASGCVAGVGIYKSTNGGNTWQGPLGRPALGGKGIGEIVVDPRDNGTLYAATTTALRGMGSSCCAGVTRPVPGAAKWGLYKSTDEGRSWRFIHNGTADESVCTGTIDEYNNVDPAAGCSPRGVRAFELDPNDPDTMYAGSYARGIWRSGDAGESWTQIKPSLNNAVITTRPALDVVALDDETTRMYVHEGNVGTPYSRLLRSDDVSSGTPVFEDLSSASTADDGYATYNQCGGQCWYDLFVTTPDGHPDTVYSGGAYVYGETGGISNGRAVVLSTDAGESGTDMTMDGTDPEHPNGLHPDQHALVVHPDDPNLFFEANDGGVMRSNGRFSNVSQWCDDREFAPVTAAQDRARCEQLLSKVPERLIGMNDGLRTLQFISLSVSHFDDGLLNGGTQDNGTWQSGRNPATWRNIQIGDGGWSGFDTRRADFRMQNFFDVSPSVNFDRGDIDKWIWTADPIYGQPGSQFYAPVITDPVVSGTMFAGTGRSVYRTKTFGLGERSYAEAQRVCNYWDGTYESTCGDWEQTGQVALTDAAYGDRATGAVAQVERSSGDRDTAWAATTTGRLFLSTNAAAEQASAVTWRRLDTDATNDPNRFISSITIHPRRPNVAFISYSGYSASTPTTPGHVFRVRWTGERAEWKDVSANLDDLPVNDLVRTANGDLYAATDFGVLRRDQGTTSWVLAARNMPKVEVAGLTVAPSGRWLYAASHGLGAYRLRLRS